MHSSFYFVPASNASMYFCVLDVSTVQFAATLFYKMHKTVSKLWYTHTHTLFTSLCWTKSHVVQCTNYILQGCLLKNVF